MGVRSERIISPAQVQQLAAIAGLTIPDGRLAAVAARLQAMRDGAALIDDLPLREIEPAPVFKLEPSPS